MNDNDNQRPSLERRKLWENQALKDKRLELMEGIIHPSDFDYLANILQIFRCLLQFN